MIVLLDRLTKNKEYLQTLFHTFDREVSFISLEDEYFLPDDTQTLMEYAVNSIEPFDHTKKDIFYAFVPLPELWRMEIAWTTCGIIMNRDKRAGRIFYRTPASEHNVGIIEWLNGDKRYRTDYYDRYGFVASSVLYDGEEKEISKSFFSKDNIEAVTADVKSGCYITYYKGRFDRYYSDRRDFEKDYVLKLAMSDELVITSDYQAGLLKEILQKKRINRKIYMLNDTWNVISGLPAELNKRVHPLNYVPLKKRDRKQAGEALIFTRSDRIKDIEKIVPGLPELHFHIAARTQVSDYLKSLTQHDNVSVYPCVNDGRLQELLDRCCYYLDINYFSEEEGAIASAISNGLLVMGFSDMLHQPGYVSEGCVFSAGDTEGMVSCLKEMEENEEKYWLLWTKQHDALMEYDRKSFERED